VTLDRDGQRAYARDVASTSRLSPDEQEALARRFAATREPADRRRLVLANLRLVIAIAKSMGGSARRPDFMDLVQEGNAGLLVAVERFDPSRGLALSAYAGIWIRAFIMKHLMDSRSAVRATTTREGRRQFFEHSLPSDVPLDGQTPFADDEALRPDHRVEASDEVRRLRDAITRLEATLPARERAILSGRLLSHEPTPLRAFGPTVGLSGERVRQLEHQLLTRLKSSLTAPAAGERRLAA